MWKIVKILKYEEALLLSYLIVERFKRSIIGLFNYRCMTKPQISIKVEEYNVNTYFEKVEII